MIMNVKFKIRMRVHGVFDVIAWNAANNLQPMDRTANYDMLCDHGGDWRCIMASTVAHDLPGCDVSATIWNVNVTPPDLYRAKIGTVELRIPNAVRIKLNTLYGSPMPQTMRLTSCTVRYDELPVHGVAQRKGE
jgi:hypothetical protein